jgi:Fungal specific transcription factor domain
MAKTARTMPGSATVLARGTWHTLLPDSAFGNDGLLYMLYSLSAMHLAKIDPQNQQAMDAYQTYFDIGLQEHSKDIRRMGKGNADAICSASSFIRILAFAILQDRPLSPYTSPTEWLQTTHGAGTVFREAWHFIENDENSITWALLRSPPILVDFDVLFAESNRQGLLHLLRRSSSEDPNESWDEETRKAYERTTSYIGGVQIAIAAHERTADICRRLMVFPMLMPKRFIGLAEELQPRALVILAYYFAMLAKFRDVWWIGDTGRREIRGIQTVLPAEWQDLMSWPLMTMEEKFPKLNWGDEML